MSAPTAGEGGRRARRRRDLRRQRMADRELSSRRSRGSGVGRGAWREFFAELHAAGCPGRDERRRHARERRPMQARRPGARDAAGSRARRGRPAGQTSPGRRPSCRSPHPRPHRGRRPPSRLAAPPARTGRRRLARRDHRRGRRAVPVEAEAVQPTAPYTQRPTTASRAAPAATTRCRSCAARRRASSPTWSPRSRCPTATRVRGDPGQAAGGQPHRHQQPPHARPRRQGLASPT